MMAASRTPKDKSYTVAGWVTKEAALWDVRDVCEWTYKRQEGDINVFARTAKEALDTMRAHGFNNLDEKKLVQTGGRLTDHLKKSEIK